MSILADIRREYPEFRDMSDRELSEVLRKKYYSGMPKDQFQKQLSTPVSFPTAANIPPAAPVRAPVAAPTAPVQSAGLPALKEVKPAGIFDYFTNREQAIKQDREYQSYIGERQQRALTEDLKTNTGFMDFVGDLFSSGLLGIRSGIKDVQAVIEQDPALKKKFQEEARRYAKNADTAVAGAMTTEDVKQNWLKAVPFALQEFTRSAPSLMVMPLGALGLAGEVARGRAEANNQRDISGTDLAIAAPIAAASTVLDRFGIGELIGAAGKTAVLRTLKAGAAEGGTEAIQSTIEYLGSRVGTEQGADAREAFEQAMWGAIIGGTAGGTLRGTGELVTAPFRRPAKAAPETETVDPAINAEFQRLTAEEVAAAMAADPAISKDEAVNAVMERAEEVFAQATDNIAMRAEGEADVVPDADTGMDVVGGVGAGIAPDIEPSAATTGAPDLGEAVTGGLERPVSGVSVPDVGEGAGISPLTAAPAFDITPIMEAPTRKERVSAANQLISDVAMATPELQALPKGKYTQAANQMATAASRGEQFDPVDIMYKVAEIERPAPAAPDLTPQTYVDRYLAGEGRGDTPDDLALQQYAANFPDEIEAEFATRTAPAAPSVDEVAVAPVKAAIEAAAAPTPTAGRVPTLAETAAREVGIAPITPTPPPVSATPTSAAPVTPPAPPVTPPAPPEMAAPTIEPTPAPPAPPAVRTVNDMAGIGTVNPDNTNEVLVEGGGIQLTPLADNILKVDSLRAVETGGGRKAMEQLIEVADANGTELQLSPEPFAAEAGKEMTPTELSNWYAGFGFQEQPDGTMVRPAPTAAPSTITPAAAATPQEILADLDSFAVSEAEDRDFDQDAFLEGVDDVRSGREPMAYPDALKTYGSSGKFEINDPNAARASSRVAGAQWAQERVAEAQAAATPAPVEVAPEFTPAEVAPTAPAQPAMEAAPEVSAPPLNDANVDAAVSVKLTKAQIKRLEQAAGIRRMEMNSLQKRIVRSRNDKETMSLIERLVRKARTRDENVGIIASLTPSLPPPVYRFLLGFQQIEDVFRLAKIAGMKALGGVDTLMREGYIPYVNRIMRSATDVVDEWADFASRFEEGNEVLDDVIMAANIMNVDPSLAPNANAYMKIDADLLGLQAEQATETDPKKKSDLLRQITKRKGEIQRVYTGGEMKTDAGETVTVYGFDDLARPEFGNGRGKKIFVRARDFYRDNFDEHYRLLMQRIDDAEFDEADADALKKSVDEMFAKAAERIIYFPVKRFGEYWLSVDGEFYMRESLAEVEALRDRLKDEDETLDISIGTSRQSLRKTIANKDASAALKNVLDLVDGGNFTDNDSSLLKDHIFQMYLTALPEADMRRRFIHREFKTGFSTDALRTFASTAVASTNQLGRLAYNYKFDAALMEAKKETEGKSSKPRLDQLTLEVEDRVKGILSPPEPGNIDWLLSIGAKGTFLFFLSGASSAFMNLTQLHIVGLPVLSGEFGEAKTAAMATRYTASFLTGREVPNPFRDENGDLRLQTPSFDFQNSAYMRSLKESDPARYEQTLAAWRFAEEHDVIESTFAAGSEIYDRAQTPTGDFSFTQAARRGEVGTAAKRATANTINAMGVMFHTSEKIGRSVMYMSSFDLAYERAIKEGKTVEEAGKEARELAAKLTNKAMFDFSNWNKSRFAQKPIGRLALQMTSYRQSMISLLVRSFTGMLPFYNKEGKAAAARVFFGVAAVTALYGGLRATHIYAWVMAAYGITMWVDSLLDDDDEDEEKEIEQDYLEQATIDRNILKYAAGKDDELSKKNMEFYMRADWIPQTFGPGGTMQEVFGLSDDNAAKLATAADMGLPALAGVDISNSVALGDLWHPVDIKSDSAEAKFFEGLSRYGLGPTGGLIAGGIKAVDAWNKGNTEGAFEAALPAIIRNRVKAERLQEEGLVIGKNRDIPLKDPNFYTTYKTLMQSLGFRDAETSRNMQIDIMAGDIEREVAKEKTTLLDERYRAILDFEKDPSKENERKWNAVERAMDIYNLTYPSNAITPETKTKSLDAKKREAADRAYGLGYDTDIPIREVLREERVRQLQEEGE